MRTIHDDFEVLLHCGDGDPSTNHYDGGYNARYNDPYRVLLVLGIEVGPQKNNTQIVS